MAPSRATCPCSNRQGSRWLSTSTPRTPSGSTFRPPSSPTPTRSSDDRRLATPTHFGTGSQAGRPESPLEPERPKISGGRSDQQDSCFGDQQEQGGHP